MILLLNNNQKWKTEIYTIIIVILCFIFRSAISILKYPFLLLFIVLIIYSLIVHRARIIAILKDFTFGFAMVFIFIIYLFMSFLFTHKLYLVVFKDLVNTFILISIFFMLSLIISSKKKFQYFAESLINLILIFAFLISLQRIMDFFDILSGSQFLFLGYISNESASEYIYADKNFAILPLIFGIIGSFYYLIRINSSAWKIILNFLLLLFSFTIFISGSRRGLIALVLILISFVSTYFFAIIQGNKKVRAINNNYLIYMLTVIILSLISYVFIFQTSDSFKTRIIKKIHPKHVNLIKQRITTTMFAYLSIFSKNVTYHKLYNDIWVKTFNSYDPFTWCTSDFKLVRNISGKNSEIVPKNAKGCLIDKNVRASYWLGTSNVFNRIMNDSVNHNDYIEASIYCFVSEDFDGSWARLSVEGNIIGFSQDYYDMNHKGSWQKLEIFVKCFEGQAQIYSYIRKKGEMSRLNGFVIFAYPSYSHLLSSEIGEDYYSKDPKFWARRNYRKVEIKGKNHEIVPEGAIGCLMDSTVNANRWAGNANMFNLLGSDSIHAGDRIIASVYCYVSEDFNGEWVRLSAEGNIKGVSQDYYNLKTLGSWQKLQLSIDCLDGKVSVYLYFRKNGVPNFASLKGYVIFAYPQYRVIKKDSHQSSLYPSHFSKSPIDSVYQNTSDFKNYSFPYSFVDNLLLDNNQVINSLKQIQLTDISNETKYFQSNMLSLLFIKSSFKSNLPDSDPIRNLVAKWVAEDTTYHPYSANLVVDTILDNFFGPRIVRWKFALQIYTKEYNWKQKIMGGGFNFLNWYGYYFYHDKTRSDWPHNPFLSILLYSGMIGLILYLIFLYKVFYYYIKYIKEYYIFFIFFLISFYFSFFSGGNPFDPPVTGFFIMLPFLIHSVYKK